MDSVEVVAPRSLLQALWFFLTAGFGLVSLETSTALCEDLANICVQGVVYFTGLVSVEY